MKLPFDKIYCLHLVESDERKKGVLNEIKKIQLENEVNFWYTTKKPINTIIGESISGLHTEFYDKVRKLVNPDIYGAVFDCAYNHYSIIKQAYLRGFNNILIIEDDIHFNDDITLLNNIIENIPQDYDVLKLFNDLNPHILGVKRKGVELSNTDNKYFDLLNANDEYSKIYRGSTLCYGLSRIGMSALITIYETEFMPSDMSLDVSYRLDNLGPDINFYTIKENLFCNPCIDYKSDMTFTQNKQEAQFININII